jgi:hypothetical protein
MADGMNAGCRVTVFSGGCWALGRSRRGGSRSRRGGGRHRLPADDPLDQRIESAVDADHDPACLNFKQSQLGQIEPKLKPLNHLRKTEPAELVLELHRRWRASVDDVLTENVGQDVEQLLRLIAA